MLTDMGLFAGVSPRMPGQGAALDETSIAAFDGAVIGSLIGVYAVMAAEIRLARERLSRRSSLDLGGKWRFIDTKLSLVTMFPGAVEAVPTTRGHNCELVAAGEASCRQLKMWKQAGREVEGKTGRRADTESGLADL